MSILLAKETSIIPGENQWAAQITYKLNRWNPGGIEIEPYFSAVGSMIPPTRACHICAV